jgi:nitroreductase
MCPESAASILVCSDPKLEKYPGFWPQDCSAAVQNLLLAARARDLGTVWCGIYPLEDRMQAFRTLFGLPEAVMPFALVALGHPGQPFGRRDRYDAAKVHWETWQPQ